MVVAKEVLAEPMGLEQRRAIWAGVGLIPALVAVASLFAKLDLSELTDERSATEATFLSTVPGPLRRRLRQEIGRGRAVFSHTGVLVQCLKEIIEHADEDSTDELSPSDLTRCALDINEDQDQVDSELLARVQNPDQ